MKFIKFFNDSQDSAIIESFASEFNLDKTVMEIIYSKGYKSREEISKFLTPLNQPFEDSLKLSGMVDCVKKIREAIKNNKRILIFGDYDVDGLSATAVMLKTLKKMNCDASYYLPNRYIDGYGLTIDVIDKICADEKPDLIITVDCGITCYKEVEYCKSIGIDIIITDHHEIPDILPDTIVVNPKLENQEYKFNGLCGTGVAFKIAQALIGELNTEDLLPIVAIATIADIVPLREENRIIVAKGLKLMKKYLPYGLKMMFKENKINLDNLEASDIAFKIAPKLNASGRMGDASDSLKLILETDPVKVKNQIRLILEHNTKRQELCNKVFDDCIEMLKGQNMSQVPAIILKSENWDSGILGIACSRLLDIYNRPVFLFSQCGDEIKGSARSINDINVHQILNSVQDILEVFGGHKVAAGLTLKSVHFDEFVKRVNAYIFENISDKAFVPIEYYDEELSLDMLTQKLFNDLKFIEPCGCENVKPRFMTKTTNLHISPLKETSPHANIHIGKKLNLIFFNYLTKQMQLNFGKEYNFIYELQSMSKNYFKGIVKEFSSGVNFKDSASKYFDALKLNQLNYLSYNKNSTAKTYTKTDLTNFVHACSSSVFGTCFVCFNSKKYKEFIESYELTNIYECNWIESTTTGFNNLNFCPKDIDWAKSFKTIVFLDSVIDMSYICEIESITNAQIFIPVLDNDCQQLFSDIYVNRNNIKIFYNNIINLENKLFPSLISIYSCLYKNNYKINFNNFISYYYILSELNIIESLSTQGFYSFKINKNKKELNNSRILNKLNFLRSIYGGNKTNNSK